jgi:hypothetical protein
MSGRPWIVAALAAALVTPVEQALAAGDHPGRSDPAASARVEAVAASDSIAFAARVMNGNKLGLTLTNYGFIGTNFSSAAASFEYPLGSSHMHMVRGGPWIGAISADENGAFVGVTTAAEDGAAGFSSVGSGEFTPAGTYIVARSKLINNRAYDRNAVSELDFISRYSDRPADTRKKHRPLGVIVSQYAFEWSFSDYANLIILHYVIQNDGPPLRNVWLGIYNELASGDLSGQAQLPPTGYFSKKYITWVDSLAMFTERYCYALPYPTNCQNKNVPEIAAVKLLGVSPGDIHDTTDKRITLAAWTYAPGSPARDEDSLKYKIMSTGTKVSLNPLPDSLAPSSGDPVELIAVGPFATINPGDSVSVDFAYLGGLTYDELAKRARVAQRAYDLHYIVPTPPPSPTLKVIARGNAVDLYWDDSPESVVDPTSPVGQDFEGYRVHIGDQRDSLWLVGQFDLTQSPHDTTGFNTGFDAIRLPSPVTIDGERYTYKFTIPNLRDGYKYFVAVTSYDLGDPNIESLESGIAQNEVMVVPGPTPGTPGGVSVFPNPYRVEAAWDRGAQARDHYLWFTHLPERCTLQIFTLSGDMVFSTDFDGRSYDGSNARGIFTPGTGIRSVLSGTTFGWDMITRQGQAIASGLYIWAVKDKDTGARQNGKVLIVKSDRENY